MNNQEYTTRCEPWCDVVGCWNDATSFDTREIEFRCDEHAGQLVETNEKEVEVKQARDAFRTAYRKEVS